MKFNIFKRLERWQGYKDVEEKRNRINIELSNILTSLTYACSQIENRHSFPDFIYLGYLRCVLMDELESGKTSLRLWERAVPKGRKAR